MTRIDFWKYDSTGNDFIIILDPLRSLLSRIKGEAARLCHRHHGIGADGIILIHQAKSRCEDFSISIINSDGSLADMCANGARACLHLYSTLNSKSDLRLWAPGGVYAGKVGKRSVELILEDELEVKGVELPAFTPTLKSHYVMVGVPHLILEVEDIEDVEVESVGKQYRDHEEFPDGVNVNFYQKKEGEILIKTYERGVEGETLCCGTGVMATGACLRSEFQDQTDINFRAQGGDVSLSFNGISTVFKGEVSLVFQGIFELT